MSSSSGALAWSSSLAGPSRKEKKVRNFRSRADNSAAEAKGSSQRPARRPRATCPRSPLGRRRSPRSQGLPFGLRGVSGQAAEAGPRNGAEKLPARGSTGRSVGFPSLLGCLARWLLASRPSRLSWAATGSSIPTRSLSQGCPLLPRALPEEQARRILHVDCTAALRAAQALLALAAVPLLAVAQGLRSAFRKPRERRPLPGTRSTACSRSRGTPRSPCGRGTWARSGRGRAASDCISFSLLPRRLAGSPARRRARGQARRCLDRLDFRKDPGQEDRGVSASLR